MKAGEIYLFFFFNQIYSIKTKLVTCVATSSTVTKP